MSWDLYANVVVDGHDIAVGEFNYTHNCNCMIREKWPSFDSDWFDSGRSSADLLLCLDPVIADMEARPSHYSEMNPSNGWGSAESLIIELHKIRDLARRHPSAFWTAWF